jgi:hypothetical protein
MDFRWVGEGGYNGLLFFRRELSKWNGSTKGEDLHHRTHGVTLGGRPDPTLLT